MVAMTYSPCLFVFALCCSAVSVHTSPDTSPACATSDNQCITEGAVHKHAMIQKRAMLHRHKATAETWQSAFSEMEGTGACNHANRASQANSKTSLQSLSVIETPQLLRKTLESEPRTAELNQLKGKLGFVYIPQTNGRVIETLGKLNGLNWGSSAIHSSNLLKLRLETNSVCTWHLVPPRNVQGLTLYSERPLFCITRNPAERVLSAYFNLMYLVSTGCNMAQKDADLLSPHDMCSVEGLNNFTQEAIKRVQNSPYDFDCGLIAQSNYIWDLDGRQMCNEIVKFTEVKDRLPVLFSQYNVSSTETSEMHAMLHSFDKMPDICPGLTTEDFNQRSMATIRDFYFNDYVNLGFD